MGGSGGGFFGGGSTPETLREKVRSIEGDMQDASFETQVGLHIAGLLGEYNARDQDRIRVHLEEIKSALEREVSGQVDLLYGGSVSKHTYVDGFSDVDALVLLDRAGVDAAGPDELRAYFARRLRARFPNTAIVEGPLAVTVSFRDVEVQLLPAFRHGDGFAIGTGEGGAWAPIHPRRFAEALTTVNQLQGNKVVPVIKLLKGALASLPKDRRLKSYHLEALAVELFRDYQGPRTTQALFRHFLSSAPSRILHPIADSTGQSTHVDAYLGAANSLSRKIVSDTIDRAHRRVLNADASRSVDQWKRILSGGE